MKLLDMLDAIVARADEDKRAVAELRAVYAPLLELADLPPMPPNFKGVDIDAMLTLSPLDFLHLIEPQDDHNKLLLLTRYVRAQSTA